MNAFVRLVDVPYGVSYYCVGFVYSGARGGEQCATTLEEAKAFAEDGFAQLGTFTWKSAIIEELHKPEYLEIEGKQTPIAIKTLWIKKNGGEWQERSPGELIRDDEL